MSLNNVDSLVEKLSSLTVLEVVSLVDALKDKWGISDAALLPASAPVEITSSDSKKAEKDSFEIILESAGESKMNVIKEVKNLFGLSLKEAKDVVDAAPKSLKSDISQVEADDLKTKLEAAGAVIKLK